MENSSDVWNDFLRYTNKDESKKETNLIVLGDSRSCCFSLLDGLCESLNLPLLKKRSLDLINYSYATVGYPNKKNTNGDYLGVIHINCIENSSHRDILQCSSQMISLDRTMFLIVVDFKDTCNIMSHVENWLGFIKEYCASIMKDQEEQYSHLKEEWSQRVLSFVQYYQKSIVKENELNASTNPVFPQGLLTTNVGVPILVTCVNTHVMSQSRQFSDEKLDFIQKFLRSVCLEYGASLAYYNNSKRGTIHSITSYILSILYSSHYQLPSPSIEAKDEVFIPVGFDNQYTVQDILGLSKLASITDFNAVIEKVQEPVKNHSSQRVVFQTEDEFFSSLVGSSGTSLHHKVSSSRDSATKPRISVQAQLASPQSKQNGDPNKASDFFKNLMTQDAGPRKSVSVNKMRRSEAVIKNAPSYKM